MSEKKRGFTVLYIPNKQGSRSVQVHLSYLMSGMLLLILASSFVGIFFLVWESTQIPDTESLLAETLEIGQNKATFEEELHSLERRVSLLEIYALQGDEESGGPLSIVHQNTDTVLPVQPFLFSPINGKTKMRMYEANQSRTHQGIDFFATEGSLVQSSHSGLVLVSQTNEAYGNMIIVQDSQGFETVYAHLDSTFVQEGDWVLAQAPLGLVGKSGDASGFHVHYELRFAGTPIDPDPYLLVP